MSNSHDPDQQFVDALEWELRSSLRRQRTLEMASGPTMERVGRLLVAALLLMAVSLAIGAAASFAIVQSMGQPQRAQTIERQHWLMSLAQTRLDEARLAAQTLGADAEADEDALYDAQGRVDLADQTLQLHRLEYEESRLAGRAPNDAPSAPRVGKRDFVGARLAVRRDSLGTQVETLDTRVGVISERIGLGEADEIDRLRAEELVRLADATRDGLDRRIQARRDFLAGRLDAREVERRTLLEDARTEHRRAEVRLRTARAIDDLRRRRQSTGRLESASLPTMSRDTAALHRQRDAAQRVIESLEKSSED